MLYKFIMDSNQKRSLVEHKIVAMFNLGGGFKYVVFSSLLGKIPILTNIFQMGWNHQPVNVLWFQMMFSWACYTKRMSCNSKSCDFCGVDRCNIMQFIYPCDVLWDNGNNDISELTIYLISHDQQ